MQVHSTAAGSPKKTSKIYYGWIIVAVVALAHMTESAEIYPVIAVLMKPMTEEFGWSRTTFTAATSVGSVVGGILGPIIGPIIDRFGAKWILLIAFTVLGIMMILQAFIQEVWHWYAIQIVSRAMAQGVINLSLAIIIPNWFVKKRARAIAISGFGGRIGNSITPIYVQALVTAYSWRWATVTTGIVMLALTLLPIALFVKRRPEDIGLLPDGVTAEEDAKNKAEAKEAAAAGRRAKVEGDVSFPLKAVIRMPSFYMLMAASVTSSLVGPAMNLHMVPYFTDKGLSPEVAVLVTTTLFLTSALGTLAGAFLAEKFGIKNITVIDGFLMGAWFLFLLTVHDPLTGFIWAATQGILQGASQTVRQVIFADYYGRDALGSIRGILHPVDRTANAIGPTAAAIAFDVTGNYVAIFIIFGLMRILSGLMIYFAKPPAGSAADLHGISIGGRGGGGH